MRVALTVLGDSFRLIRARMLFWVAVGISVLAALLYLSVGFSDKGITLLFGAFDIEWDFATKGSKGAEIIYLGIFRNIIVGWWFTWIAAILALIAYAPVVPEFMEDGAAGVTLSKPVSRQALYLYKFLGGLVFLAIQIGLFAGIVVIAIRWRLGFWSPSVLWSVPLVLLVFSYLLAVMMWLGVKTRSVMASVLLTLLFWVACFLIQFAEAASYGCVRSGTGIFGTPLDDEGIEFWEKTHRVARIPYSVTPKTGGTIQLLDRWIVLQDGSNLAHSTVDAMSDGGTMEGYDEGTIREDIDRSSPLYIIGTSLLFEFVILGLGMRDFCRRDF